METVHLYRRYIDVIYKYGSTDWIVSIVCLGQSWVRKVLGTCILGTCIFFKGNLVKVQLNILVIVVKYIGEVLVL